MIHLFNQPLIKAKLVAVESKRITIQDEFLAYTFVRCRRSHQGQAVASSSGLAR